MFQKKAIENKTKIEENKIRRIAEAFRNQSYLASLKNDEFLEIAYLDSIINFTRNKNVWNYPSFAYYIKGLTLYDRKDFKNSLDSFIEAHRFSKNNQNLSLLYDTKYSIATLKSRVGEHEEALKIFKDCYYYAKINLNNNRDKENFLVILQALSDEYYRNNKIDSSSIHNKEGINLSTLWEYKDYSGYFIFSEGINHFERGNYKISQDSIEKSISFLKSIEDKSNLAFAYFYLGKINQEKQKEKRAVEFYRRVDSLCDEIGAVHPDLRGAYESLISYYKKNDDKNNQLTFTEKLIRVDKILVDDYKYLSKNLIRKFDTPELLASKERLLKVVNKDNRKLTYLVFVLILIALILVVVIFINIQKKKKYRKKFKEIIKSNREQVSVIKPKKEDIDLGVPEGIVDQILSELDMFESHRGFVENDITISALAKKLSTNTKYLSKVINHYHKKTFINYINSLRIDYTIEKLKTDKVFRKYTVKAISAEMGFKNPESFSQAFYKNKGIYPSFFIKELNKRILD
ncbi:helix-turn-helix domain-containing protein [uncultured Aquimarina sp.]|uniref:helix-turn-helix domain-containing protein n=1 Tax=uncultured Aquimarina sp. TaxID=575652 RepID=UPI0026069D64|nr:helix-turn-helix domain-containing protein [uncultured Aquimarina sp.]